MAQMIPVSSSMISAVGYDPETQILEVEFSNGRTYSYSDVPQGEFDSLLGAQSVGKYFLANVKDRFRAA